MSHTVLKLTLIAALACTGLHAHAEGNATAEQAQAMVKKGVSFIKANGKEKGYAEVTNKAGAFIDRDLYLVVYGLDGTVRAHGANDKMVGKNLIELKDAEPIDTALATWRRDIDARRDSAAPGLRASAATGEAGEVGMIWLQIAGSTDGLQAWIYNVEVDESARRRGYAPPGTPPASMPS